MSRFFSVAQIIEIHDALLEEHGGAPGIRDFGLLASAVETPRASVFGAYLHKTVYDQAAAYLYHIIQNHPFNDGNPATAALTALLFLEQNNATISFSERDYEEFVVEVTRGIHSKEDIAYFLQHGEKRPS